MAESPAVPIPRFTPQQTRPAFTAPAGSTVTDTSARVTASEAAITAMLAKNQMANLAFDPGTIGDSSYLGDVDQTITRGYIRRASPDSSDPMSQAQLNFMYNPEQVVRDYVSYLDQQALDPFNTVYNSGNLIAPPSFINFSFALFFDRQVQTSNRSTSRGVLEDYDFFDLVVRNVAPGGGTTAVPDNGIMMVNPKDIMVVFSEFLTVQGRPTNASVSFERFNSKMVPTRMTVNLTMIVTYFGPLRDAFTLDTSQAINQWQAMVPYSNIYSEEFTQAQADAAQHAFDQSRSGIAAYVNAIPRNASWAAAGTTGAGVATVGAVGASGLAASTLGYALSPQGIIQNQTQYTQGSGRTNLPASADCSGAVWRCYNQFGASKVLHGSDGAANTASIAAWGRQNNWQSMQIVCLPRSTPAAQIQASLVPGDLLLRTSSQAHVVFFNSWVDGAKQRWNCTHQTNPPRNGTVQQSFSYLQTFDWALRPNPSGSTTSTGTWVAPVGSG